MQKPASEFGAPTRCRHLMSVAERLGKAMDTSAEGVPSGSRASSVEHHIPTVQHTSCLLIQANVTSLATLGSSTFDGQHLPLEVNAVPTQGQKLAASQSGIHGKKD